MFPVQALLYPQQQKPIYKTCTILNIRIQSIPLRIRLPKKFSIPYEQCGFSLRVWRDSVVTVYQTTSRIWYDPQHHLQKVDGREH